MGEDYNGFIEGWGHCPRSLAFYGPGVVQPGRVGRTIGGGGGCCSDHDDWDAMQEGYYGA